MAKTSTIKTHREPLFHIVKRDDMPAGKAWLIRGATIVISFIFIGLVSMTLTGEGFGEAFETMFFRCFR